MLEKKAVKFVFEEEKFVEEKTIIAKTKCVMIPRTMCNGKAAVCLRTDVGIAVETKSTDGKETITVAGSVEVMALTLNIDHEE